MAEVGQNGRQDPGDVRKDERLVDAEEMPDPYDRHGLQPYVLRLNVHGEDVEHLLEGLRVGLLLALDDGQERAQFLLAPAIDFRSLVGDNKQEGVQDVGQVVDNRRVRHLVHGVDPAQVELAGKLVLAVHPLLQDGHKLGGLEALVVGDNVLEEPVQEFGCCSHALVGIRYHDAHAAKDFVEHGEDVVPGDLRHIVERLAGVKPEIKKENLTLRALSFDQDFLSIFTCICCQSRPCNARRE